MAARWTLIWLQVATLATASPLRAQQAAVDPAATPPGAAPEAGQRVGIDPQTRRLRGLSPEEARTLMSSLLPSLNQSDAGLVPVILANGARLVDLQGRFEAATLARMDSGRPRAACVTTVEAAAAFLTPSRNVSPSAPAARPATLEER